MRRTAFLAAALAALAPAALQAAERPAAPLAAADCEALARSFSEATGIAVTTSVAPARSIDSRAPRGNGCVIVGTATGLTRRFDRVEASLIGTLRGWTHDMEFDADGPMSTVKRFTQGTRKVIVSIETENLPGTCADIPIGDCRVPLRRWTWTFKAVAYAQ